MVQTGDTSPKVMDVIFLILQILGLFAVLLIGSIVLIPRLLHVEKLWKSKGSIEGIVTASFFGAAGIAAVCWAISYRRSLCCWYGGSRYTSY